VTATPETPRIMHVLVSGSTAPNGPDASFVARRGDQFTVDAKTYESTLDRNGNSFLDLTPEEQIARWGVQRYAEGPKPDDVVWGDDDEVVQLYRQAKERDEAYSIQDPASRRLAILELNARYGHVQTSRTISKSAGADGY
jgi:hypothetical protein